MGGSSAWNDRVNTGAQSNSKDDILKILNGHFKKIVISHDGGGPRAGLELVRSQLS